MRIDAIDAFDDNYIWLLSNADASAVGVVDPGDPAPVDAMLSQRGWRLTHILCTHHHDDHIGGNDFLKRKYGATLIGAGADSARIPGIDIAVADGDTVPFGDEQAAVLAVPGHTSQHIAYWFADAGALFSGDTLFALGCGRLFDGTAAQLWTSLSRLRTLPPDTRVYFAHEYTASNARFAETVESGNAALAARIADVRRLRADNRPTVPSRLGDEVATNPFLRADVPAVQAAVGMAGKAPADVFAEIRRRKDVFR